MSKFLLSSLISLFAFTAFAADVTTFNCELTKIPSQKFSFKIKNLGKPSMTFLNLDPQDDYSGVFSTKSKNKIIVRMVSTLNGQGGDLRILNDRIQFFGDDAGVDFAYLELFNNSGYKAGFARLEFNFGEDKNYSPVFCIQTK